MHTTLQHYITTYRAAFAAKYCFLKICITQEWVQSACLTTFLIIKNFQCLPKLEHTPAWYLDTSCRSVKKTQKWLCAAMKVFRNGKVDIWSRRVKVSDGWMPKILSKVIDSKIRPSYLLMLKKNNDTLCMEDLLSFDKLKGRGIARGPENKTTDLKLPITWNNVMRIFFAIIVTMYNVTSPKPAAPSVSNADDSDDDFVPADKRFVILFYLPTSTVGVIRNETLVFVNFSAQDASILNNLCAHHQEEILTIPKHPQTC